MARKNPVGKLAETALSTLKDPVGTAGKVVDQAKGTVAIGKLVAESAGSAAGSVVARATGRRPKRGSNAAVRTSQQAPGRASSSPAGGLRAVPDVNEPAGTQPAAKAPAAKKAPVKAPVARKAAEKPADSLKRQGDALVDEAPAVRKAPAAKAPSKAPAAKKAPAVKKAPVKKTAAKEVAASPADVAEVVEAAVAEDPAKTAAQPVKKAAKKAPAKKAPAKKVAATRSGPGDRLPAKKAAKKTTKKAPKTAAALAANETDEDVRTPSGIPAVSGGKNPDTSETDLTQPGTEPIIDPATAKKVASESKTMGRAAESKSE